MAENSSPFSVSRIRVEISIGNKGIMTAELARHLAPLTCSALLKAMPFEERIHKYGDSFLYVESKLVIGSEKQKAIFKQGDVAYMTSNGAVCFFLKDSPSPKLNPIGHIVSNLELLNSVGPGDVATIKKVAD